jgi:hypothetical protein
MSTARKNFSPVLSRTAYPHATLWITLLFLFEPCECFGVHDGTLACGSWMRQMLIWISNATMKSSRQDGH